MAQPPSEKPRERAVPGHGRSPCRSVGVITILRPGDMRVVFGGPPTSTAPLPQPQVVAGGALGPHGAQQPKRLQWSTYFFPHFLAGSSPVSS